MLMNEMTMKQNYDSVSGNTNFEIIKDMKLNIS